MRTEIIQFEPRRVREIFIRELNREGQIYFVHNRIEDILRVVMDLRRLVPEARTDHAHGQMNEHELEEKMVRFFEGDIDCLVSTTIIENGLDIPNVNTIFIDDADRYGLADLHQLRGRVGRYKHQAYCYLILPGDQSINPEAQRRLQALVEFSDLGSGFQIALRDLEIRGAGNILGPEQSGHIAAVGYDMYCRLMDRAVKRVRKEEAPDTEPVQVEVDLALEARVPEAYRHGEAAKIAMYRRVAAATTLEAVDELGREFQDRYGPYPAEVATLLDLQRLRILCAKREVEYVGREDDNVILRTRCAEGRVAVGTTHLPSERNEGLRTLLEGFQGRVVVLDSRTVAIPLVSSRRRYSRAVSDARIFQIVLRWLATGEFSLATVAPSAREPRGIPSSNR